MADPQINGDQTGIVIDAESKDVLAEKGDQKAYPRAPLRF
jgi:D-alanyl-D-alanine carboxypeptidase